MRTNLSQMTEAERREHRRTLDHARYLRQREERLAAQKEYDQTPKRKQAAIERASRYRELFPEKNAARNAVHAAIQRGDMVRRPCDQCGNPKSEAHHPDYSKPLEVVWLCRPHHIEADKMLALSGRGQGPSGMTEAQQYRFAFTDFLCFADDTGLLSRSDYTNERK